MSFFLLARYEKNGDLNRWLDKNPIILGLIFLAIGFILLFYGIYELKKGIARDKYGNGGLGKLSQFSEL